jgi:hypothetical protein
MIFMTRYYKSQHLRRIVSVPQNPIKIFMLTLMVMIAAFAISCEKGLLKEGGDLLPNGDFVSIKSIDTLSIFSYTMYNDSARSDLSSVSYLGHDYDPYFGSTTAGFVTQIRLNPKWDGLPFTVDSMKLFLHILTTKAGSGASDVVHSINISEISDMLYVDTAYYPNTPIHTTGFQVSNIVLPTLRTDTINDVTLSLPGNGVDFGKYITRDTLQLFYNNTKPDFRTFFKGLYFEMNPTPDPYLISLSVLSDQTTYYNYFVLFVHDTTGTTKTYSFNIDAKNTNASFNVFSHDYSTATLGNKMIYRNTTYKDTVSYLQALDGVYTRITLPGLKKIKSDALLGKVAVNRARLVVPVYFTATSDHPYISKAVPSQLFLRYVAKNRARYTVPDYSLATATDTNHDFFDGKLDTVAHVYNFNIPSFVQQYLQDATGNVEPELEIYQGAGTHNAVLGANKSRTPVKFEFTYTKF